MKKPVRKAGAMGNDSSMKKKAILGAANRLIDISDNPKSAAARPKGTRPAAPWAIKAGADMSIREMGEKLNALNKKRKKP